MKLIEIIHRNLKNKYVITAFVNYQSNLNLNVFSNMFLNVFLNNVIDA